MDWELAGAVILSGLSIVFIILIILIGLVMLTGKLLNATVKERAPKPAPVQAPVTAKPLAPMNVQSGIEEETVAVISAAVYACLSAGQNNSGVSYRIRSVSRAAGARPVWGFAGMQQNTRPF